MTNNPCTSKTGVQKKAWAREMAARFVADWDTMRDGKPRRIYLCPVCEKWHTTTSIPYSEQRAGADRMTP